MEYNISLLTNSSNPHGVHGAKGLTLPSLLHTFSFSLNYLSTPPPSGIGEPPLCASVSVVLALKDAILAARAETAQDTTEVSFDLPLTVERTRLACGDLNLSLLAKLREEAHEDEDTESPEKPRRKAAEE